MKNKKGIANPIMIIIVIIAIILIIYYGFLSTGSFVTSSIYKTTTTLISSDEQSATYKFTFVSEPQPKNNDCSQTASEPINYYVESTQGQASLAEFVDGLIEDTDVETTNVQYYGINAVSGICSDLERGVAVSVSNAKAKCKIRKNVIFEGVQKASIVCQFTGTVNTQGNIPAKIYGLSNGEATIRFLKKTAPNTVIGQPAPEPTTTPTETIPSETVPTSQATNETPNCYANIDCTNVCTINQLKTCTSGKCFCSGTIADNQPVVVKLSIIDQINRWIQSIIDRINSLWKK